MASAKFEKGSEEWQMFIDYWNICQKYWFPENNENYWEQLSADLQNFIKKYKDCEKFSGQMANAFNNFVRELSVGFVVAQEKSIKKGE